MKIDPEKVRQMDNTLAMRLGMRRILHDRLVEYRNELECGSEVHIQIERILNSPPPDARPLSLRLVSFPVIDSIK